MRKNGFTLIELLAVIVILAIIALIATPIILGIINDAREKANERSVELYASAVRNGIAAYQLREGNEVLPGTYTTLPFEVEYDGNVVCEKTEIYKDGKIYVEGCTVNGGEKTYNYGTKQESNVAKVCTRQNDEEGFDTVTCTIGENTESFYVMNSYLKDVPSDKIVMMTKYNVDPTTYKQSSTAGTVEFSNTNYWSSTVSSYPSDVYDSNSLLYPIVNEYVSYLNTKLTNAAGTLLTHNQAENLGCIGSHGACAPGVNGGGNAPSWVSSTGYWTGSANDTGDMWLVDSRGYFVYGTYGYGSYGVRPVITISTSDIK